MDSPMALSTNGKYSNGIEDTPGRNSPSRDHHSSSRSAHKDYKDRGYDRDRDRKRGSEREHTRDPREDRHDRDRERHHHSSSRRHSGSEEKYRERRSERERERERDREKDRHRDRDRSDRDRDRERGRDKDRDRAGDYEQDRERDRDRDREHRRRKLDEVDGSPSPRLDDRYSKRLRESSVDGGAAPPSSEAGRGDTRSASDRDLLDRVSKSSARDRSRESDRRSSYTASKPGDDGPRHPPPADRLPVDDRSPPPYDDRKRRDERYDRRRSPPRRRRSPEHPPVSSADSEARSVFVSQLAARVTARDLGYFFEEKLGEGSVIDPRIVTDRLSRRSKGIAYVELGSVELVQKALDLSGTIVMGLPIKIQLTESEKNKVHSSDIVGSQQGSMQLYVGSLHFNLTEQDIKQVFEPFGELEFVDLHRDPATGRSKGYAFVQFKRAEDAKMALEQMEGFELAGRQLRVNTVHEKSSTKGISYQDSLDENGGSLSNNTSRHMLMQKLARTEHVTSPAQPMRPVIPQAQTRNILLKNMFDPAEESGQDWDKELAEDVKSECQVKHGRVSAITVDKDSQGEIYVQFDSVESASSACASLNGRWFGGKLISAAYISDAIMQAHLD
ncbi:uncharacterized protein EI90DRAFT_3011391 [Cantharellus anzutake]|uniref:uncharacterized protein n=1 Tax=Cantharellus anzutake TaxID=1750568 RepID=UPI001906733C|nr:uncharacterized protein EI90DRAFT_3011391 [Cantharellus anzutake]KAF8342971.1 hypothetical protein EI90DRAFT_3011391 [Cantharellus anzutake]